MESQSDEESLDPWGDTPAWEQQSTSSDNEGDGDNNNITTTNAKNANAHAYAAHHVLILIDTHPSMFQKCINYNHFDHDEEEKEDHNDQGHKVHDSSTSSLISPFDAALIATERLLHHKVQTVATSKINKRDGVGVLLYGTPFLNQFHNIDSSNNDKNDDHDDENMDYETPHANSTIKSLIELAPPGVRQIKTIRSCLYSKFYDKNKVLIKMQKNRQNRMLSLRKKGLLGDKVCENDDFIIDDTPRERDLEEELFSKIANDSSRHNTNGTIQVKEEEGGIAATTVERVGIGNDHCDDYEMEFSTLRPALHEANRVFNEAKCVKKVPTTAAINKKDAKTIWIFTNQDNPTKSVSNSTEKEMLITVANDVIDNGNDIRIWPLPNKEGRKFDRGIFYNEIVNDDSGDDDHYDGVSDSGRIQLEDGTPVEWCSQNQPEYGHQGITFDLDNLLDEIGRRWKSLRKVQTIPILLPDYKMERCSHQLDNNQRDTGHNDKVSKSEKFSRSAYQGIMIDLYPNVRIKGKPNAVTIDARTNKKTNRVSQIYSKATGEILTEENIRHFTEFGGVPVQISKDEVDTIKKRCNGNLDRAGLLLLGFKPLPSPLEAIVKLKMIDKSMFAYPNNVSMKGSKAAFATLHASMIRKNVMGIGELLFRVTASSRLVAIIPQKEERVVENVGDVEIYTQISPPGFILVPLAFHDDMRALPQDHHHLPDRRMIDAATDLIRHQNIEESIEIGQSFDNPVLKRFWNYIESVALGTQLPEDFKNDDTAMNVDDILTFAGDKIKALKQMIPFDDIKEKPCTNKKRKVATYQDEKELTKN